MRKFKVKVLIHLKTIFSSSFPVEVEAKDAEDAQELVGKMLEDLERDGYSEELEDLAPHDLYDFDDYPDSPETEFDYTDIIVIEEVKKP